MDILTAFQNQVFIQTSTEKKIFLSILFIGIIWIIRKLLLKLFIKKTDNLYTRYQWQKITTYIAFFIVISVMMSIWTSGFKNALTYIGIVSAGLAIALQSLISNLAGWLFILWRQPFRVGDRIQIGKYAGDVMDLRLFQFLMMEIGNWVDGDQSTGRVMYIPNSMVFKVVLANYNHGFQYLWNEIPVLITFESDWKNAKAILTKIADKHGSKNIEQAKQKVNEASRRFLIFYSKLTPIVYTNVKDSGVMLTIRYLCKPKKRRSSMEHIWEDILDEFAKYPDIDLAYPTQRFYTMASENDKNTPNLEPPKLGNTT